MSWMNETYLPEITPAAQPIQVTPENAHFSTLIGKEPRELFPGELLGGRIQISYDQSRGGKIFLSMHHPISGKYFCTLKPYEMGESRWYSLELGIDIDTIKRASQIIPILEASSARNVTLSAVLRIGNANGQFTDTGSSQIVLGRRPSAHSLPISLSDLPEDAFLQASSARIIFFIEARDVAIDFFSLMVVAVSPPPETSKALIEYLRQRVGESALHHIALGRPKHGKDRKIKWSHDIDNNIRIDIDSSQKQFVHLTSGVVSNRLDFTKAIDTRWRTLELRFDHVENTGNLATLISFGAESKGKTQRFGFFLRVYNADWTAWDDKGELGVITLGDESSEKQISSLIFDKLPDNTLYNNIGLICFIPNECDVLDIHTLEAFIYDTRF